MQSRLIAAGLVLVVVIFAGALSIVSGVASQLGWKEPNLTNRS